MEMEMENKKLIDSPTDTTLRVDRGKWSTVVRERHVDTHLVKRLKDEKGLSETAARVVAGRGVAPEDLWPSLADLDPPALLPDIAKAAQLIAHAVVNEIPIVSASDSDSDGNSAQAIIYEALTKHFDVPQGNVLAIAGHKLKSGYGLTQKLVNDILAWRENEPKLIITSDMGSSDEPRIRQLKEKGHRVVVTDHHEFPVVDGRPSIPESADAVVSPARPDSEYPDRKIAGCYVAFLVMTQVRQELINMGFLPAEAPKLTNLIGLAALGTVVDCVSMSRSKNNRALVRAGLKQVREGIRPCWRVANRMVRGGYVTSEDFAFLLGPAVNAYSRVGDPLGGANFFLAPDESIADFWWTALETANEKRKKIERAMTEKALKQAEQQVDQGRRGVVVFLEDGHAGIHGINAARITERFGRPCGFFSPQYESDEMLTGSFRTVEGFHVKQGFDAISKDNPDILPPGSYGGHAGAGGARIKKQHLETFRQLFDHEVARQVGERQLYPTIETDGWLEPEKVDTCLVAELESLEPYGREFPEARFMSVFRVARVRTIGKEGGHVKLVLKSGKRQYQAVWFFVDDKCRPKYGVTYTVVYAPKWNHWKGEKRLQLMVVGMLPN
ncbi:DHH family phosphoesterase [Thiolapillus sp.]